MARRKGKLGNAAVESSKAYPMAKIFTVVALIMLLKHGFSVPWKPCPDGRKPKYVRKPNPATLKGRT